MTDDNPPEGGEFPSTNSGLAFDATDILVHVDGDIELLREIAQLFFEDSPKLVERISNAVDAGDAEALSNAAHALKGAISNFAAQAAFEAARTLEFMGRDGDLSSAGVACDRLVEELERLTGDLARFLHRGAP